MSSVVLVCLAKILLHEVPTASVVVDACTRRLALELDGKRILDRVVRIRISSQHELLPRCVAAADRI